MNITISLDIFCRVPTIGIRIDLDADESVIGLQRPFVDGAVKRLSRWWTKRMAS